ncbi:DUF2190 family protein [bacterium]|nr:DUF2190 family protein [bacterium]
MSQSMDTGYKSFTCDEALAMHARVKLDSDGRVTTAGLADQAIGTARNATFAAGDAVTVKMVSACGTHKMIAVEALAAGAVVYGEAAGKVQDTAASTSFKCGIALEAATADGDVIEVMMVQGETAN